MKKIGERRDAVLLELDLDEYALFVEIVSGRDAYPIQHNLSESKSEQERMLANLKMAHKVVADVPYAIRSLQRILDSLNELGGEYGIERSS